MKRSKSGAVAIFIGVLLTAIFVIGLVSMKNPDALSAKYRYDFALDQFKEFCMNWYWIAGIIREMRCRWPDCAITLSLGEHSREVYDLWRECGADRYLLRHETHNADHYASLHPAEMSHDQRMQCLQWLKELGYQTGTGIMVGSPGQTVDHLIEDLQFIREFRPEMVGLGPFIAQHDTPLGNHPNGTIDMTTRLYSLVRLMLPCALIPSTTALATLSPEGRLLGILAGANVVMPNLSPADYRDQYALYDGKAHTGSEAAEGLRQLAAQLATIGYHIDWGRGDSPL